MFVHTYSPRIENVVTHGSQTWIIVRPRFDDAGKTGSQLLTYSVIQLSAAATDSQ
jgi:hypothetical protein